MKYSQSRIQGLAIREGYREDSKQGDSWVRQEKERGRLPWRWCLHTCLYQKIMSVTCCLYSTSWREMRIRKTFFSTEYLFSVCLYIYILSIYKRQEKRFNLEKDSYDFLESSNFNVEYLIVLIIKTVLKLELFSILFFSACAYLKKKNK